MGNKTILCPYCGTANRAGDNFCAGCGYAIQHATGQIDAQTVLEGRYVIMDLLGQGGMGAVYRALDRRLDNSMIAIKEISTAALSPGELEKSVESFKQEASMLVSLRHHALPRISDFFSTVDGRWFLVMDYIEGETLEKIVRRRGRIPQEEVVVWARQLCDVLGYLHGQTPPVIFRDLKPSNIMLTAGNEIKIIDFGIARHFRPGISADTVSYASMGFAPPEQFGAGHADQRSDIFALGAIMHYLLSGITPAAEPFRFKPFDQLAGVSPGLSVLIMEMLELNPHNRPRDIGEIAARLAGMEASVGKTIRMDSTHDGGPTVLMVSEKTVGKSIKKPVYFSPNWVAVLLLPVLIIAGVLFAGKAGLFNASHEEVTGETVAGADAVVPDDYPSIQAAIDGSLAGHIIKVRPGIYHENIDFGGKEVTLQSINPDDPGVVESTIINGGSRGTVVTFQSGESPRSVLNGFTITGGSGTWRQYKIVSYDGESMVFKRQYGGGILVTSGSSPTVTRCVITDNTVRNVTSKELGIGGGIAVLDSSSPLLEDNRIVQNIAEGYGGGLAVWYRSNPIIRNNVIENNRSDDIAGGILVAMMSAPVISNNQINYNDSDSSGGIYVAHMSEATITNNHICYNNANLGAGIFVWRTGSVLIRDNVIAGNKAKKNGGGMFIGNRALATAQGNTFENNVALVRGGAIWVDRDSQILSSDNISLGNTPDDISYE